MRKGYTAFVISADSRQNLLDHFPPKFPNVVCHHITMAFKVAEDTPLPANASLRAIGYAADPTGVEALVVEVDGSTERPSGGTFHVTLSLADGRKPVESNNVIAQLGFVPLPEPVAIEATATFIPFAS